MSVIEVAADSDAAVAGIPNGVTALVGGFGDAGQPMELIDAPRRSGTHDLTLVSNNAATVTSAWPRF
jgi:3-oxoadipate CoA-transferase, alpha subunit